MNDTVIIDGNNLLFAMHEHGPTRPVGRVALVRMIERWAIKEQVTTILVFDGHLPSSGMAKQITSKSIEVRFSDSRTADEVIIDLIEASRNPSRLRIVTSDKAIRHEAERRKCRYVDNVTFIQSIFDSRLDNPPIKPKVDEYSDKPTNASADEIQQWIDLFSTDDDSFGDR